MRPFQPGQGLPGSPAWLGWAPITTTHAPLQRNGLKIPANSLLPRSEETLKDVD